MDEVGELCRVSQEEDGSVVGHVVPIALFCSELDREASRITSTVMRARFATNGRETNGDGTLFASLTPEVGRANVVKRLCALEDAVCSTTLGMDNSFWNPLTVEVRNQIDEVKVLEEKRAVGTGTLGLVGVRDRGAIAVRVDSLLG